MLYSGRYFKASLFIVSLFIFSPKGFPQDTTRQIRRWIVKTDVVFQILANNYRPHGFGASVAVEKIISTRSTVQVTTSAFFNKQTISDTNDSIIHNETWLEIIPEYKFFFGRKKVATGVYADAFIRIWRYRSKYEPYENKRDAGWDVGICFGYQNYIKKRVVVDALAGIGFGTMYTKHFEENYYKTAWNPDPKSQEHAIVRLALNIGYKF